MFLQHHFIFFLTTIYSGALAAIHDEAYINKHGPFGLIIFKKNDIFVDWVRVPEVNYQQWVYALKFWRTVRGKMNCFSNRKKRNYIFLFLVFYCSWNTLFNFCCTCSCLYNSWFSYKFCGSIWFFR
jgi:hypothetical protein